MTGGSNSSGPQRARRSRCRQARALRLSKPTPPRRRRGASFLPRRRAAGRENQLANPARSRRAGGPAAGAAPAPGPAEACLRAPRRGRGAAAAAARPEVLRGGPQGVPRRLRSPGARQNTLLHSIRPSRRRQPAASDLGDEALRDVLQPSASVGRVLLTAVSAGGIPTQDSALEASAGFHHWGAAEASEAQQHPRPDGDSAGRAPPAGPPGGSQANPLVAVLTRNDRATAPGHFQARRRPRPAFAHFHLGFLIRGRASHHQEQPRPPVSGKSHIVLNCCFSAPPRAQDVRHLEFAAKGGELPYAPGDSLAIRPLSRAEDVRAPTPAPARSRPRLRRTALLQLQPHRLPLPRRRPSAG